MGPHRPPQVAAPQAIQIRAERRMLTNAEVERYRDNPFEGRGAGMRVVIYARLLEAPRGARRPYIVARIPFDADALGRRLASVPEPHKEAFLDAWMDRNRVAMIGAYLQNRQARPTFEYVQPSAVSVTGAATPRRTAPRASTPRRAETPPPGEVTITRRRRPTLPPQIRGGSGTSSSPFVVIPSRGRARSGIGATEVSIPFRFNYPGTPTFFRCRLALSQLRASAMSATISELTDVMRRAIMTRISGLRPSEIGINVGPALNEAAEQILRSTRRDRQAARNYLERNR